MNLRDCGTPFWNNDIVRNPWIWGAIVFCVGLLLAAVYWPWLSELLQTSEPGMNGWLLILGLSLVPAMLGLVAPCIRFYSSGQQAEKKR